MTIDEAITQLSFLMIRFKEQKLVDKAEAIRLGIEALKYVNMAKTYTHNRCKILLVGETEEVK